MPAHRPHGRSPVSQLESVSLVRLDHPEYRECCRRALRGRASNHVCDTVAREYHTQLLYWEEIVRAVLADAVSFSLPERILMSRNRIGLRQQTSFLEVDFVSGSQDEPQLFVEIKLRERTVNPDFGRAQLRRSLGIARSRWPDLRGVNVCVAMGELLQTEVAYSVPTIPLLQLPEQLEAKSTDDGKVIWLDGCDIANYAVSARLLTIDSVRQLPELRLDMLHPTRILDRRVAEPA